MSCVQANLFNQLITLCSIFCWKITDKQDIFLFSGTHFSTVLSGCSRLCSCSKCCSCWKLALVDIVSKLYVCENETSCKNFAQEVANRSQGRACPAVTPDITSTQKCTRVNGQPSAWQRGNEPGPGLTQLKVDDPQLEAACLLSLWFQKHDCCCLWKSPD